MSILNIESFEEFKDYLNNKKSLIVDFRAPWCEPCKKLAPVLEELSKHHKNITFLDVNVEKFPLIGAKYFVRSLPTVIFFVNGKAHSSLTGTVNKQILENKILSFFPG